VFYLIHTGKKIRSGDKKTWLGDISNAIMLGSVPEKIFKIYIIVVYLLHITAILKIIF